MNIIEFSNDQLETLVYEVPKISQQLAKEQYKTVKSILKPKYLFALNDFLQDYMKFDFNKFDIFQIIEFYEEKMEAIRKEDKLYNENALYDFVDVAKGSSGKLFSPETESYMNYMEENSFNLDKTCDDIIYELVKAEKWAYIDRAPNEAEELAKIKIY